MRNKKNVLIFCVDQMRGDHMSVAGNSVIETPNLDRLASNGVYFPNASCNNPVCMPARATMFSGMMPRDHGIRTNGQRMHDDIPVLPEIMRRAGYSTHAAGKLHLTPVVPTVDADNIERYPECMESWRSGKIKEFPLPYYGFDSYDFVGGHTSYVFGPYIDWLKENGIDPSLLGSSKALEPPSGAPQCYKMAMPEEFHYNRFIADSTIRQIESSTGASKPFFVWCSFPDPHHPIAPPSPYCDKYSLKDIDPPVSREGEIDLLPSFYSEILEGEIVPNGSRNSRETPLEHWLEMKALTYGMITHIDTEIGRVMSALEKSGAADDTVVVFISDHGDMMGDHGLIWKGFYTFRSCTNIPLIISVPGMEKGKRVEAPVSQVDLMPTVLDLCGVELPGAEWPRQESPYRKEQILPINLIPGKSLKEVLQGNSEMAGGCAIIEGDDATSGLQPRCIVTERYRMTVYPGLDDGELFDLQEDPHELRNLWYDKAFSDLKSELTFRLLSEYASTTPMYPVPRWTG